MNHCEASRSCLQSKSIRETGKKFLAHLLRHFKNDRPDVRKLEVEEKPCRAAWSAIANLLVAQMPPDFPHQFLRLLVALDRVRDGTPAIGILNKLVSVELTNESKWAETAEMCRRYGMVNEC